jgi:ligand-binding sensor domain-containing protein/two-component sensor histidine kinase
VLIVLASPPVAAQHFQRYTIDRWTLEDGLPNNAITQILPGADGYLWIATDAGVARFDGVRFTPVDYDLPNDHVRGLLDDRHGARWFALSGDGLVRVKEGRVDRFTPANGLPGKDSRALAEDAQGRVWVATESGVSVIDDAALTTLRIAGSAASNMINSVRRSHDGRVWIASSTHVCEGLDAGLRCSAVADRMGEPYAALQDRQGGIWVGAARGVFRDDRLILSGTVTTLFEARDGTVWVGFRNGELAAIQDGRIEWYRAADGLPAGGLVGAIAEDDEGSIWVGTYNAGFSRLRLKRVRMYTTADGLPAAVVGSIVQDRQGSIWAGTDCGPVSQLVGDRFVPRFVDHTKDACVWVVFAASDGSLWMGTRGHGVFRWTGTRMQHFDVADGLGDGFICSIYEDRHGAIWIGTHLGGLHRFADGTLSRAYREPDGVVTHHIVSLAEDRDGRLWIGSNGNGLAVHEHGSFRILPELESPPTRNVAGLLVDSRGDLWVGSAADGLFRRRAGRYEPFGLAQGLGDRLVAVFVEDGDANFWVATARGIKRLAREKIDAVAAGRAASLDPIVLDRGDGVTSLEGSGGGFDPSGLRDRDGRIWISTIDGIAVVDPSTFAINTVPPRVMIESIALAERPATPRADGVVEVPAGTAAIDIAYTASSRLAPGKVRFRYRLIGQDPQWREVGDRRAAYFTRLPPGSYAFQVIVANNDHVWSTSPTVVRLEVAPFWWERTAVRLSGLVLLLVATGVTASTVVQRRAKRRLADLERERALERERTRIARDLHDDLGSRLSYIAMMANKPAMASKVSHSAREAVQTLDELVWTVNARNDTVDGFAAYAGRLAEEVAAAAGLRLRLHAQPNLSAYELAADLRRHVYLAFKEALNNAVKHAQASALQVEIAVVDRTLRVVLADDGRGLEGPGDPTGNGLTNMRERMAAAGGTVRFESTPGEGCRVTFELPLAAVAHS